MKVFWSWQSDTPGKTGRHFVRQALEDAVARLNTPKNIEEPLEREVELDHDRKNVPGSPDLAALIFGKIESSDVVVADVTPVVTIERTPTKEDKRSEKGIMNPNVAVELGYALRALKSEDVLMVLNVHYGDRHSLPFDLTHKVGPIMYDLPPDADASTIKTEQKKLAQRFYESLRPYLKKPVATPERPLFQAADPTFTKAIYFGMAEPIAQNPNGPDLFAGFAATGRGLFLRVIPVYAQDHEYSTSEILQKIRSADLRAFGVRSAPAIATANKFGPIVLTMPQGDSVITGLTQVFRSGEIWGYTPWFLRHEDEKFIPVMAQETALHHALKQYVRFLQDTLNIRPPYRVIAGLVGAEGYSLRHDDFPDTKFGPIYDPEREREVLLASTELAAIHEALKLIFQDLFRLAGHDRPTIIPYPWNQH
ncbi:hypothetical protein QA648_27320 (plasmid) [Rhizobium sp. CB3171]|uniref:hypothetical protein n=1 Tax=Rhizobium sp. CB3171 TaxID=3039157 RepID=UPI0024B1A886|nr:hypothetical protein [Rhizobium sp. CB3171]WFU04495.1 hypothetical protein QA648_27320 [Rhizobium sp. CB3171]